MGICICVLFNSIIKMYSEGQRHIVEHTDLTTEM